MPLKIVGISGRPVKKGNVDSFLGSIMDLALEKRLDAETINLSRMEVKKGGTTMALSYVVTARLSDYFKNS